MMQISKDNLDRLIECRDITEQAPGEVIRFFRDETEINNFLPEQGAELDPRTGEYTIFNAKRAVRPADNNTEKKNAAAECVICEGRTTGIVDLKSHSRGYTFINKNLFPILYPFDSGAAEAAGFHFLQWTSSGHEDDWTNMPDNDLATVVSRLAALEGWLLKNADSVFPEKRRGWVSIIKNYGRKVGGSLEHDHQQIGFSSVMPGRVKQNLDFLQRSSMKFSTHLIESTPESLVLHDYGPALLIVSAFMKRPLDMMLVIKDSSKDYLHELTADEIRAVARGWSDAISMLTGAMPELRREPAYNVITNTGCGIYFEFLPFTQEFGGFEKLGLYLCQMLPEQAFEVLKSKMNNRRVRLK